MLNLERAWEVPTDAETPEPIVEVSGLVKTYGAIQALKGVDLAFRAGQIHGLVGANGAGKSTLVRILAGLESPDDGAVVVRGTPVTVHSPAAAARLGFAFIHQELNLVRSFTAAQNILLGNNRGDGKVIGNFRRVPPRVTAVAERVGISFPLDKLVAELTVHEQWLVTIARALINDSELIVMDEPTGSLDAEESDRLLKVCTDLAAQGVAVVFISHRLDEVMAICDEVTVFRDGAVTAALSKTEITRDRLIQGIVGHALPPASTENAKDLRNTRVALEVSGIRRGRSVNGATLRLHEGELLGIAGLVGAGRTELARIIFGADAPDTGTMRIYGAPYSPQGVRDAMRAGVAYVPEERRSEALFLQLPVTSNLHAANWGRRTSKLNPFVSQRRADRDALTQCQDLGVVMRAGGTRQPISALSGGNQQKVVIGRWLETGPKVLVLDEPTRGVDIGARSDIYRRIREIAERGMSVIVISSEFEELLECDRVAVMSRGRVVGELTGDDITVPNMLGHCYA
ncbi:sugar ABC transporter ATP-binding protein [Agromyces sp. ZXT2-6]|uniref:sugar ABC transporter ATP-binding protein n=1 Tax=Agromyces sp. ZXT2-6 TaxID=3461153 RepID=UPI004054CFAB